MIISLCQADAFFNRWGFMVIFWNFAGVPFVSNFVSFIFQFLSKTPQKNIDVLLLDRLHGHASPREVPLFDSWVHRVIHHTPYSLLYVSIVYSATSILPEMWITSSFDSSMSQKSRFRMQMQGTYKYRWTFPQLPWGTLKNPTYIQTAHVSHTPFKVFFSWF